MGSARGRGAARLVVIFRSGWGSTRRLRSRWSRAVRARWLGRRRSRDDRRGHVPRVAGRDLASPPRRWASLGDPRRHAPRSPGASASRTYAAHDCAASWGTIYSKQGAYARAHEHLQRNLVIEEELLGPNHPYLASDPPRTRSGLPKAGEVRARRSEPSARDRYRRARAGIGSPRIWRAS